MSWPLVDIAECLQGVSTWNPTTSDQSAPFFYVDLSSVDKDRKEIDNNLVNKVLPSQAPSRARQLIKKQDVLVATVRPNLNGVAIVPNEYDGATASTGYCVLRSKENELDSRYLFYWVQTTAFVSKMMERATGANYPAVSDKIVKESQIPLPPLAEQKRIAAILDKADAIRRKRQQAIQLADEFLRATFLEMFGDPVTNLKGWDVKPLKELSVKISSGSTPKGGSKVYVDKGITFFRSQNVWKNDIRLDDVAYIDQETHKNLKKSSLKHKDILMTKTGRFNTENSSLGRAALFLGEDDSANVNGHVYLIRLKENLLHEFVVYILTSNEYREHIRNVCVGGIDKRQLNKDHIEDFPIILPPQKLQNQFMQKLNLIQGIRDGYSNGLKDNINLLNGLSQKAFSGQL